MGNLNIARWTSNLTWTHTWLVKMFIRNINKYFIITFNA